MNKLNTLGSRPAPELLPHLQAYVTELQRESSLIPQARKALLQQLAAYVRQSAEEGRAAGLHFICTHNSRRSQLSQVWAATAAVYYGLPQVRAYSGGTEATAFNPRAIAALERAGFAAHHSGESNPLYQITFSKASAPLRCFSKTLGHPDNPQQGFAAIMTCTDAEENCPYIPGAAFRLSLPYEDPKAADGTPEEGARYDERTRQVGREMFYAMQLAARMLNNEKI
ncbi:low molecular weight phosphatase family protein [Phaeodactylibacter luteus]|nr:protein-tyrosine-phosphatase [Phaeodactylibacter luteus]